MRLKKEIPHYVRKDKPCQDGGRKRDGVAVSFPPLPPQMPCLSERSEESHSTEKTKILVVQH